MYIELQLFMEEWLRDLQCKRSDPANAFIAFIYFLFFFLITTQSEAERVKRGVVITLSINHR